MARKTIAYEDMLRNITSGQGWFESSPYRWKEVDPGGKGEKEVVIFPAPFVISVK